MAEIISLHLIFKAVVRQLFLDGNASGVIDEDVESRLILQNLRSELADGGQRCQIKLIDNHIIVARFANNVVCKNERI